LPACAVEAQGQTPPGPVAAFIERCNDPIPLTGKPKLPPADGEGAGSWRTRHRAAAAMSASSNSPAGFLSSRAAGQPAGLSGRDREADSK